MSVFEGFWRMTWMQARDRDFTDLVQPFYYYFEDDLGTFGSGAISAGIDARFADEESGSTSPGAAWTRATHSAAGAGSC